MAKDKQESEQLTSTDSADKAKSLETDNKKLADENEILLKENAALKSQIENKPPTNIKGFVLAVDDPFGDGAIRAYRNAGGKSPQPNRLPFVLPVKDKEASKAALDSYIIRASGGNDKIRVAAAKQAIKEMFS